MHIHQVCLSSNTRLLRDNNDSNDPDSIVIIVSNLNFCNLNLDDCK